MLELEIRMKRRQRILFSFFYFQLFLGDLGVSAVKTSAGANY